MDKTQNVNRVATTLFYECVTVSMIKSFKESFDDMEGIFLEHFFAM